jgi:hypothetical protein
MGPSLFSIMALIKKNIKKINQIKTLWALHGVSAFYKGLGPSLVSIVPYMAIQLSIFEAGKAAYLSFTASQGTNSQRKI